MQAYTEQHASVIADEFGCDLAQIIQYALCSTSAAFASNKDIHHLQQQYTPALLLSAVQSDWLSCMTGKPHMRIESG